MTVRKIREAWWGLLWDWAAEGNREDAGWPRRGRPLLGETEDGEILMPSKVREDWWDRRFNARNPTHWPTYLRSRRARSLVLLGYER